MKSVASNLCNLGHAKPGSRREGLFDLCPLPVDTAIPLGVRRKLYFDLRNSFGTPEMKSDCAAARVLCRVGTGPIDPAVVQTCVEMDRLTGGGAAAGRTAQLDALRLHREGRIS